MIGYYNYTVIATYCGLASALCGLWCALANDPKSAIFFLLLAGLFDAFDGKIAATRVRTDAEKKFGIQIDSLSDVVAFGVLPAAIGYTLLPAQPGYIAVMVCYVLCAVMRLAYFNVNEEERQSTSAGARKEYRGLPVTSAALAFPLLWCARGLLGSFFVPSYLGALLLLAVLFILPFRFQKPTFRAILLMVALGAILATLLYLR